MYILTIGRDLTENYEEIRYAFEETERDPIAAFYKTVFEIAEQLGREVIPSADKTTEFSVDFTLSPDSEPVADTAIFRESATGIYLGKVSLKEFPPEKL